jgi:outer membrane protein TolC
MKRLPGIVLLGLGLAAAPGFAAPLSPAVAVERALQLNPEVAQAAQEVAFRRGILLEERGRFDPLFQASSEFKLDARELIGAKLDNERSRRLQLHLISLALEKTASEISGQLGGIGTPTTELKLRPQCETDFNPLIINNNDGRRTIICRDPLGNVVDVILISQFEVVRLRDLLAAYDDPLRGDLGANLDEQFRRQLAEIAFTVRSTSIVLREQFERLGVTPDVIEELTFEISLAQQLRFRNGSSLNASLLLQSSEENFEDKPHDPAYGDSVVPNTFTSSAGLSLVVPLGRGGGVASAGAPEAVAREQLATAVELLGHQATLAAAETLSAYWLAAASRDRLATLFESETLLERIVGETQVLVDGDQLAGIELDRARARRAEASRDVARARQDLAAAEAELARRMGIAADEWPSGGLGLASLPREFPELGLAKEWIATVGARRHDLLAAARRVKAGEILERAAKADLRPQIDFSLDASYNVLYESYEDRLYELSGFSRAWDGKVAGPSYGFRLKWLVPIGSHEARGRRRQAAASLSRGKVQQEDLRRSIRLRLHDLLAEAQRLTERLRQLESAEAAQRRVVEGSVELFENRELGLIDTLVTESRLTELRLGLVEARYRLTQLSTDLRFEAGRLLEGELDPNAEAPELGNLRLADF